MNRCRSKRRPRKRTAKHEQRLRVGQHAHRQHRQYPNQVVHLEVVDVLAQTGGSLPGAQGARQPRAHARARRPTARRTSAKLSGLVYAVRSSSSVHGRRCARVERQAVGTGRRVRAPPAGRLRLCAAPRVARLCIHLAADVFDARESDACVGGRVSASSPFAGYAADGTARPRRRRVQHMNRAASGREG